MKSPVHQSIAAAPDWQSVDLTGLRELVLRIGAIEQRLYEIEQMRTEHFLRLFDATPRSQGVRAQTIDALEQSRGRVLVAAMILGITEPGVYARCRKFRIRPGDFREAKT